MDFRAFKSSEPAKATFRGLGIAELLEEAQSWQELRRIVTGFNDRNVGRFVSAVKKADGVSSSGERVLLHAVCCAMDFAWLADELAEGKAWQHMDDTSGDFRRAVAACILSDG